MSPFLYTKLSIDGNFNLTTIKTRKCASTIAKPLLPIPSFILTYSLQSISFFRSKMNPSGAVQALYDINNLHVNDIANHICDHVVNTGE